MQTTRDVYRVWQIAIFYYTQLDARFEAHTGIDDEASEFDDV